jgi:hypothetical protein
MTTVYTVKQQWRRYEQMRKLSADLRDFLFSEDFE